MAHDDAGSGDGALVRLESRAEQVMVPSNPDVVRAAAKEDLALLEDIANQVLEDRSVAV